MTSSVEHDGKDRKLDQHVTFGLYWPVIADQDASRATKTLNHWVMLKSCVQAHASAAILTCSFPNIEISMGSRLIRAIDLTVFLFYFDRPMELYFYLKETNAINISHSLLQF
ncbi:hypothetical protein RRG08_012234 [Elysia crispata]|uniref:Uncharacterized protein n=1 Tax=Elysia crispata TaxID=231223 RepID=A0AAE1D203_9GAST|nr:hypothetical protein RRG08_012234 [Elysia crispata]